MVRVGAPGGDRRHRSSRGERGSKLASQQALLDQVVEERGCVAPGQAERKLLEVRQRQLILPDGCVLDTAEDDRIGPSGVQAQSRMAASLCSAAYHVS